MANNPRSLQPRENAGDLTRAPATFDMRYRSLSQRALPPTPMNIQRLPTTALKTGSQTSSSPVSLSIHPSIRSVSRASSGRESRSTSPSIANLSQLSVVRQRLAQIERTSFRTSEGGLESSIGTLLTSPVPSLRPGLEAVNVHAMKRDESGQSSAADSILDSYGDQLLNSPDFNLRPPIASLLELKARNTSDSPGQTATVPRFEPVNELLHGHSEKSCNRMIKLCEQILSLRDEIHTLPRVIASAVDNEGQVNNVLRMVTKLEQQATLNKELLGSIHSKMDKRAEPHWTSAKDDDGLTKAIRALQADVTQGLTHIRTILEPKYETETLIKLNDVSPSASQLEGDISHLNSKIDDLLDASSNKQVLSVTNVAQLEVCAYSVHVYSNLFSIPESSG